METKTPTPAREWKGKVKVEGTDLALPSGNVALVKQISPDVLLTGGMMPDPLTGIVREAIHRKKGLNPANLKKLSEDPVMLASAMELFDRVLVHVVVQPPVSMPPACSVGADAEGEGGCGEYANKPVHKDHDFAGYHAYKEGARDKDVLYADQVVMQDKLFIFNWCVGGTKQFEEFREQLETTLGSIPDGEDVQVSS